MYKIELTSEELNIVNLALIKMPYEVVVALIASLNKQLEVTN